MDIKYKDKDMEISIKNINKNAILTGEELDSVMKIIKLFKDSQESVKASFNDIIKSATEEKPKKMKAINDRPDVRDRLPNQVDLSELEIKKAVTEEPMIRCPICGQSSTAIVCINEDNEYYLLRKVNKKGKDTFETTIKCDSLDDVTKLYKPIDASPMDYYDDITKIKISKTLRDTDMNVSNDTKIICPVCTNQNPFSKWVDAFKHPLDFGFETEMLCDICGEEAVETIDKDKNKIIQCEHCGFKKPAL
jgi:DNA-directed RNA polymerase subunit RPC12/RpoP